MTLTLAENTTTTVLHTYGATTTAATSRSAPVVNSPGLRDADSGSNNEYNIRGNKTGTLDVNNATFHVTVVISDVDEPPAMSGDDTLR